MKGGEEGRGGRSGLGDYRRMDRQLGPAHDWLSSSSSEESRMRVCTLVLQVAATRIGKVARLKFGGAEGDTIVVEVEVAAALTGDVARDAGCRGYSR